MYPGGAGGQMGASAYDRVATMFSPDGRLYQVEYASKIVDQGTLACGVVYNNGVIFAADKKVTSKLLLPESIEKLFKVDNHIGAVSSGLVGDARRLIQFAREKSQENLMHYGESIHVEYLVKEVSAVKQAFTQYAGMRPFGVAFIFGGVDDSGFRLFETEPSGALAEYKAVTIGSNRKPAMKVFEKGYYDSIPFEEAVPLMLAALDKGLGEKEKLDINKLDFAYIDSSRKFRVISKAKIKSFLGKSKK
jgi:proteasome alpha subunit